ncbi:hypothetical protein [Xanthomarina spongicola]|uniref:Uncharacterized protein n=1 Tax=Xanthomarina spongicola TaxID=570520 RepID=A0A316DLK0_9FLAO|nr:hypothetical protein [Xanthomarina spongicola]PWK19057.1 hypothetical protein LX78_01535 [Xanthomarina spongicola]
MAKIIDVKLTNVPDLIVIGDDKSDLTVDVNIEFHDIDLKLEMEYMLYIFVYDVHGKIDIPILITNWDDSDILPIAFEDSSDDFLGTYKADLIASKKNINFKKDIFLKLGILNEQKAHYAKKIEVLAFIVPAIARASKWSKPYMVNIGY